MNDRDTPVYPLDQVCFIDFESRSSTVDLKKAGATAYACGADAIILAFAIGDEPVVVWHVADFSAPLDWQNAPKRLQHFFWDVVKGDGVFAAWNAGFDRAIWNYATTGFPEMLPHYIIDPAVQATASGLPPDLKMAARFSGAPLKDAAGADLISLFCKVTATATPQSHPEDWQAFIEYAGADIEAMRGVFQYTRQLSRAELAEMWAMEKTNDRGLLIDMQMVRHAAKLAAIDKVRGNQEIFTQTRGAVSSVDEVAKITTWLLSFLPPAGRDILTERIELRKPDGSIKRAAKYSLERERVEALIAYVKALLKDDDIPAVLLTMLIRAERVLLIRLYGGSKMPQKFEAMLHQQVGDVLYGQYRFNGAPQTGRASSRGVQIHNLPRDYLPYELEAVWSLQAGAGYDDILHLGDDTPVARKLSLLLRPAIIARPDKVFVWSDWSQIEARVLPWLADHYGGAKRRLDIFREVDADPSLPDLYTRTAAELSHCAVGDVTKAMRQRGKVAELALGFLGGVGALKAMASGYGLYLPDDEAKSIVKRWREVNSWAGDYGREIWSAVQTARDAPGVPVQAGRCWLVFLPGYLSGTLLARLPSGRHLAYRRLRIEKFDVLDDEDNVVGAEYDLGYMRGHGKPSKLWPGIFVENFTQACAADFLRGTLVRLEQEGPGAVFHTHDEIGIEVRDGDQDYAMRAMHSIMVKGFDWSEGLPLMSDETSGYYYSKAED
jgi:DNA polymerase